MQSMILRIRPWRYRILLLLFVGFPLAKMPFDRESLSPVGFIFEIGLYAALVLLFAITQMGLERAMVVFRFACFTATITCFTGGVISYARSLGGDAESLIEAQRAFSIKYVEKFLNILSVCTYAGFAVRCFPAGDVARRIAGSGLHHEVAKETRIGTTHRWFIVLVRLLEHVLDRADVLLFVVREEHGSSLIVPRVRDAQHHGGVWRWVIEFPQRLYNSFEAAAGAILIDTMAVVPALVVESERL